MSQIILGSDNKQLRPHMELPVWSHFCLTTRRKYEMHILLAVFFKIANKLVVAVFVGKVLNGSDLKHIR